MTNQEQTIYDLVHLGIRGDTFSVRQVARRLLHTAPGADDRSPFYGAIERLLADSGTSHPVRSGSAGGTSEIHDLLRLDRSARANRPVLAPAEARTLDAILAERSALAELSQAGLDPTKSLLLTGAPGVGKTMTAAFIARALGLPLYTMDLANVVSRFLGRTGQNLRHALDFARATPCVLLLDEFDALAKRRDDPTDLGELKRIVNVLLLELEVWPADSVLIAATNHPELLDRAIWRRFDRVLTLGLPDRAARFTILADAISEVGLEAKPSLVRLCAEATEGTSGSDLVRHVRTAARDAILRGERDLGPRLAEFAMESMRGRSLDEREARMAFCALACEGIGMRHREVAPLAGVTHTTVGRLVAAWRVREAALDGAGAEVSPVARV